MKTTFSTVSKGALAAVVAAALVLVSPAAFAKAGKSKGMDPERRVEFLTIVLDLSEEQQAAILPLVKAERDELDAVREKYRDKERGERKEGREEIKQIHEKYTNLIVGELDQKQAEKYLKLEEFMRKNGGPGHGPEGGPDRGPGPGPDRDK